ncbi:hypothetical protein EON79_17520 [bacterium]|nr:MAG: hypothetical protein EON79_17520 [bacterium]
MDLRRGADVATIEEAEGFIKEFIVELRGDDSGRMRRHSREYDLFLPWLWEEITTSGTHLEPTHTKLETNELYMEAAWELVQKGYLRPGPPKTTSQDAGGDYGKGYTLTFKGKAWLGEPAQALPVAKRVGETDPREEEPQEGETQPDLDASPV